VISIAHIINPVSVGPQSDLHLAQPVTFATMKAARDRAAGKVNVKFYAACFPEDEGIVPDFIKKTRPLDRSILDVDVAGGDRKLPLIADILQRLKDTSRADYFIYTNVDIALMPDFYLFVAESIRKGYDAIVINRRTIGADYTGVADIPEMYRAVKSGRKHPGYDCFVFRRSMLNRFNLGTGCIGANWIGRILICNLMAHARKFILYEDQYLTFHIGDRTTWRNPRYVSLEKHNERELIRILGVYYKHEESPLVEQLKEMYFYHVKRAAYRDVPPDLLSFNAPERILPSPVDSVYPKGDQTDGRNLRQDPIFVVGYPRSGTTLIQALIATQPGIISLPETHFFSRTMKDVRDFIHPMASSRLDDAIRITRTRISFSRQAEDHVRSLAADGRLTPRIFFETLITDNLLDRFPFEEIRQARWMEKTSHHAFFLPKIFKLYPAAKVIYVMRHPEKAILSRRKNFYFNNEYRWPIHLHVHQWTRGVEIMERWRARLPEQVMMVRLEDVVDDHVSQMQRISTFLDIELDETRLETYPRTAEHLYYPWEIWKSEVCGKISADIARRTDERLNAEDCNVLKMMAFPKIVQYGYSLDVPPVNMRKLLVLHYRSMLQILVLIRKKLVSYLPTGLRNILIRLSIRANIRRS
jgi:hypothetical protein